MADRAGGAKALLTHYLTLRRAIGVLGILLPLLLWLGGLLVFRTGLQKSISAYYHTGMRNVFVGTLCVIGFFLRAYKGYERVKTDKWLTDNAAGNLACVFAVGVALLPPPSSCKISLIGALHWVSATLFFLTLIYFSLHQFTKTGVGWERLAGKVWRDRVYKWCGGIMIGCIGLIAAHKIIAVLKLLPGEWASFIEAQHPIFWLEGLAIIAFGFSWLTKGKVLRMKLFTFSKKTGAVAELAVDP